MTTVRLSSEAAATAKVDAVVIGVATAPDATGRSRGRSRRAPGAPRPPVLLPGAEAVDEALGGRLAEVLGTLGSTGKKNEVVRLATLGATTAPTVLAVGVGDAADSYPPETLRRAAGAAARALAGTAKAATTLARGNGPAGEAEVAAVAEGSLLGAYRFDTYRSAAGGPRKEPVGQVDLLVEDTKDRAAAGAVRRAAALADAVGLARDLTNTPPADLFPGRFAEIAAEQAGEHGLAVEVLDEKALRKGGYGGLLGVGAGSSRPPRLVRVAYTAKRSAPTVALIGKGITFDSGGLSLKPAASMEWMKSDMAGAAAVLAAVVTASRLRLPVNVVGWLALAENLPSGTAIRPSDVLTIHGGRTVEVLNTDAEGRLVLADAIVRAGEESPDAIVDVATLTGAQLVALGTRIFAVMGNDDGLREQVCVAAERAGESAWPMPLPPELRPSLDSAVADIANMGDRSGGMLVAGLFLKDFVPDGTPWAHLDVAGPAYNQGDPHGYTPKGGTGVPVRTLVALLEDVGAAGSVG